MQGRTLTSGFVVGVVASGLALTAIGTSTDRHRAFVPAAKPASISRADALSALAKLPTAFAPARHGFAARGSGYDVVLARSGVSLALQPGGHARPVLIRSTIVGGRKVAPVAESRLPGVINEYQGPRSKWREAIPTFARVRYASVYRGIDAVYHGRSGRLQYDFEIAPGADPSRIATRMTGVRSIRVAHSGDLVIRLATGTIRQTRPVAYQRIHGQRVPVGVRYRLSGDRVGFVVGDYDRAAPLVIDPVLNYASYAGGNGADTATSVGLGTDGSIFIAGGTRSSSVFLDCNCARLTSDENAFVTRFNPGGAGVIYTTILGNSTGVPGWSNQYADDRVNDLLPLGTQLAVVGETRSQGIPEDYLYVDDLVGYCTTQDGHTALSGQNGFLTYLSPLGQTTYSTCFGGNTEDSALALAQRYSGGLGKTTHIAVVGSTNSSDFGAGGVAGYQPSSGGGYDGFLLQIGHDGNACDDAPGDPCYYRHYRTYIGGSGNDAAYSVAYDSSGYAVVSGDTTSANFPASSGSALGGTTDAWIGRWGVVAGPANARTYLLRYGGDGDDSAYDVVLDSASNSYIVGSTSSTNLPAAATSGNLVRGGGTDGFIAKLTSGGSVLNSVYVGGTGSDSLNKVVLQESSAGIAEYAAGSSASGPSSSFAPRNAVPGHSCTAGNTQALVVKRINGADPEGAVLACLGGAGTDHGNAIAVSTTDATDGAMWIAGDTTGAFPGINGTQSSLGGGGQDAFVAELTQAPPSIDSGPADGGIVSSSSVQFALSTGDAGMHFGCSAPSGNTLVAGTRDTADCPASTASYSGLVDGQHTFEATTRDAVGSESAPATRTFTVDTGQPDPFDLTAPAEGEAVNTTQPTFRWSESHDTNDVSYSVVVDTHPIDTVAPASCSGGTCSAQAVGPILDGPHTVKIVAADGATPPNTRDSTSTRNFTVVDPVQARFTIAPNPALVGRTVAFNGSASADVSHAITKYEWDLDGDGAFETDTGTTPTTSRTFLSAGTFNVGLRVTGDVGGVSTSTQSLKVNEASTGAAQIGVSINQGAQYTNTPSVKLKIVAPGGVTALLVSNDGGFAGALPQAVTTEVNWKLDSSGPERLPKTVYLRFLTGPFASPNYTDDIILDERAPVVNSASVAGSPAAAGAIAAKAKTWKVKVKATDTNSGVGFVQVTTNKRKPGKLLKYKRSLKAKSATRPKFLRARDRAGNYSRWKKLR